MVSALRRMQQVSVWLERRTKPTDHDKLSVTRPGGKIWHLHKVSLCPVVVVVVARDQIPSPTPGLLFAPVPVPGRRGFWVRFGRPTDRQLSQLS